MAGFIKQNSDVDQLLLGQKSSLLESRVAGSYQQFLTIIKLASSTVQIWFARYRQRQQLRQLSEFALKDIGVTRADALQEADKPFWRK